MNLKRHIPNAITLLNLLCGCLCIGLILNWEFYIVFETYTGSEQAVTFLQALDNAVINPAKLIPALFLVALLADFADGLVARKLRVSSALGKQLDSLADLVTFGVLPSVAVFSYLHFFAVIDPAKLDKLNISFAYSFWTSAPAFLIAVSSALRLGRFNVDESQTEYFKGLATPASAIFWMGLMVLIIGDYGFWSNLAQNRIVIYICIAVITILLNAPMRMFSFKFKSMGWQGNQVRYIFLLIAIVLLIWLKFAAISLLVVVYILTSLINNLIRKWSSPQKSM